MDGWDLIIISAAIYIALATLVRLMRTRLELRRALLWLEFKSRPVSETSKKQPSTPKEESATDETRAA